MEEAHNNIKEAKSDSSATSSTSSTSFTSISTSSTVTSTFDGKRWFRVASAGLPANGDRLHTCIEGRFVTIFRHNSALSCIDAPCHHAGGPLTLGPLQDIEELGMTVVLCPWHKFMVSISDGTKAYQKVEIKDGRPTNAGWVKGRVVQRSHFVKEDESGTYVSLNVSSDTECSSDRDACDVRCMHGYNMHEEKPRKV